MGAFEVSQRLLGGGVFISIRLDRVSEPDQRSLSRDDKTRRIGASPLTQEIRYRIGGARRWAIDGFRWARGRGRGRGLRRGKVMISARQL